MEEAAIKKQVGAKIKSYRNKFKLTQFKLGELAEINQRQIAMIECGKSLPSLSTLLKLSNIFECTIADFFDNAVWQDERELKLILKKQIDELDYANSQRLYIILNNLFLI